MSEGIWGQAARMLERAEQGGGLPRHSADDDGRVFLYVTRTWVG